MQMEVKFGLPIQFSAEAASLLALILFLYCLFRRKQKADTNGKLPQPSSSWPLIGHLHLMKGLPHIVLGKLADIYGPIFMIKLGVQRALVVSTAEMAKECLGGTNDKVFLNRPQTIFVEHLAYNGAMLGFSQYGQYWREIRKITTIELLSNHRVEMFKKCQGLRGKISHEESMKECYQGEEYNNCVKVFRDFFELAAVFVPADALPFLRWFDIGGYEKKMKKVAKEIDHIAQRWLDERKNRGSSKEAQGKLDFMDVMLGIFETGHEMASKFETDTIVKATCTIWDNVFPKYSRQKDLLADSTKPFGIVVTSTMVKYFNGKINLNTSASTKIYIELQISEVDELKSLWSEKLDNATIGKLEIQKKRYFNEWLLAMGDERLETKSEDHEVERTWIEIPYEYLADVGVSELHKIVEATYPDFELRRSDNNYLKERAILTPLNETTDTKNEYMMSLLPIEERTYKSCDEVCLSSTECDQQFSEYPTEYLNSLKLPGLPHHELKLKECLVTGYSDSDYAADVDTRRSVTGYVFTLGAELDIVVGKERQVEESDLKNLVYMQAVLKEAMRLYPAVLLSVPREDITDCTVSGYSIPAGTQLFVNLYKIQRDPQVWENSLNFHPERFLTSHKDYDVRGQNFELMPFVSGRRICPGISFALAVIQFTLASLLHGFDISIPSDEPVDMTEGFGITNLKVTPLEVILRHRQPKNLYN
uniref:Cytochrome P450 n=1 Tax=Chenopodium quinoa TaxID=63459 RepID=A0A803NB94_CHEQI